MTGLKGTFRSGDRARQQLALLAFLLLVAGLAIMIPSNATSAGQNPIEKVKLSQRGQSLILQVRTNQEMNLGKLDRRPASQATNHRYLCLLLTPRGRTTTVRICFGGKKRTYRLLGVSRVSETGEVRRSRLIPAKVKKIDGLKLVATFDPREAGLPPGKYGWQVASHTGRCPAEGPSAKPASHCLDHFPAKRPAPYYLRPIRAVGCTGGNGELVTHGPRGRKRVALTFDDGPSDYTADILRILRRKKAKGTFFMLGQQVARYPSFARRVLALGHEVANHSYEHDLLPGAFDIHRATRRISRVTGFRPCLFRPPYGAVSSSLRRTVREERMKVVNWDVDTSDWKLPGAGAIAGSIVRHVRPGSIVLMHDGGGPRSGTVEALAPAIGVLRRRGYELVTVSELLGNRTIYRPVP